MIINGVQCDTYAALDDRKTGEAFIYDIGSRDNFAIVAYLYQNNEPYPLDDTVVVECYFRENHYTSAEDTIYRVDCSVGDSGEIYIDMPDILRLSNAFLFGEINVSKQDEEDADIFRMKATNFQVCTRTIPKALIDSNGDNVIDSNGNQIITY